MRVDGVTDLFGKSVKTSPQLRDLLFEVNGGANIHFGQHWLSAGEMADPFGPQANYLTEFDPLRPLDRARSGSFEMLEDEIWTYQETLGLEGSGQLGDGECLVLFGYNLVELCTRPTYLFFRSGAAEPVVWSAAIDWVQTYPDINGYLDALLP